ncbi:NupC/NupG family nucleoside CNT transporter [Bacillus cytotoxicus]|uniref:Nucleoside permease n=2 Tax=Bacillus cytotoxicus TaxID=580165 RepID=A0AAX2CM80_9BACI|nr:MULTISPECIES: NupC/NupG family nucleoside CNT transporter [Bacillus cereus group]ABS23750.1 nucleoside transporter [Bacillus cytotoxicus NVH 391-98]AWC30346.1 NupC/NupG family nucleoside CNT transporter [Bacillus cytotoxicus]AWC34389.1 NupC/NupG family nucleoside CNT transporter [Bacillus cytotoxicus]AWC38387.1 NupC/NupG family nucleoside CNT transporter [Bacillus cytotoxicus]AWC42486.1 NupC/NupG family nucleoside CNT transporter [Bacillus cytotoxicus]
MNIIWGVIGIIVILFIGYLLSNNKRAISLRTVFGGLAIQVLFGFIVLEWDFGRSVLEKVTQFVQRIMDFANAGILFLFGNLGDPTKMAGFVFAFRVLPILIFLSSVIAILYHLGIMQWMVRSIGGALAKLLGTSQSESLSAAANIFLGQTEAPLVIRPYMPHLTKSELFAVMVGGLASVSGSTLFGYAALGVPLKFLLAASVMAAPAGLIMAKLLFPETEKKEVCTISKEDEKDERKKPTNVIDAAARGAADGLSLALNVGAMLIAFIAVIALLNGIVGGIGGLFGYSNLSLQLILGYIFSPLAFAIGVPWTEAITAGGFIGEKLILNEFVAFTDFAPQMGKLSEKTTAMITFALCGFANLSSVAILLGGLGGMAPNRRGDIAKFGVKSIIAGTLANLLSAAIAGMFA